MTPRDAKIAAFAAGLAALMTFGAIKTVTGQDKAVTTITSARLFQVSEAKSGFNWGIECCGVTAVPDAGTPIEQGCESAEVEVTFQKASEDFLKTCETMWKAKKGMP